MVYFGQVFVFCRLINKNVLEWFLQIIFHTLNRSANFFSRNDLTLCFWLRREGQQYLILNSYFTKLKKQPPEVFYKNAVLSFFQYSQGNTSVKFLRITILKNICRWLLLNWLYKVTVWNFVSLSDLKPSQLSNITKIPVAFKSGL